MQELANPYVGPYLQFYPHDPRGKYVHALYECVKWREDLCPHSRVQMVASEGKHYYIFEPVGLKNPNAPIMVPIFFYKYQETLYSKCMKPKTGVPKDLPYGSREFELYLPGAINWHHRDLVDIPVSEFKLTYSELRTYYGESYVKRCGNRIIGKNTNFPNILLMFYPN